MTNEIAGLSRADLDRCIEAYLRANALRMEDHERVGPFLAGFDRQSDNPYRNYAVPDDDASPSAVDVAALIAAFVRRVRTPRLEYVAEAAPCVEPALLAHGFVVETRFPLLACAPGMARDMPMQDFDIEPTRDERDLQAAAEALAEAYNDAVYPDPFRRLIAQGGVLAVARERNTGLVVGAGMATPAHEGVCEIAGIGVRPAFQKRGIAGALTALLTREAFAHGVTLAWLTPGHDDAERIYARAGFVRASEQLHISKRK
jgi:ribosomal protein S18 acetylase RimI-like enzyme